MDTSTDLQVVYPNNGFRSYWKHLSKTVHLPDSTWISKCLRTFQTSIKLIVQILKDAGIELFFLVVFWLIIKEMSQGRDLIVSLFEPEGIYSVWRIFYTTLSIMSFSLSMWIIPAFLFEQRDRRKYNKRFYRSIFKEHLFFVHRILPLFPFWLVAFILFNGQGIPYLFAGFSLLQLVLLFLFNQRVKEWGKRKWYAVTVGLLLLASIAYFSLVYKSTYTQAKIMLSIILYLISFLMYFIYHEVDMRLLEERAKPDDHSVSSFNKYKINSWVYCIFLTIHVVVIILIFAAPSILFHIAPESMMLYIFSLDVFLLDLFVYFVSVTPRRKIIATFSIIIIILLYWFSPSVNLNVQHYSMDKINDSSILRGSQRLTFEDRFVELRKAIDSNKTGHPYPIILISGEGGGSRAGMWFSQNLINYDYYTRGLFREHIFSISTVSGSSVGLSTLFAFWDHQKKGDSVDQRWLELPGKVYANNFVGSSISGLLLTDFWKTLLPWGARMRDRNSTLQDEEAYQTQRACQEILESKKVINIPDSQWTLRQDFMDFFYTKDSGRLTFKKGRPLVFINTCRSNDGRRGIFSPVKLTNDVFNDAIDILGYRYEDSVCNYNGSRLCLSKKQNVSFIQACNTSELFPILSAPAYIDGLGSFVDGGYHENSGLKTTLDVYEKLTAMLEQNDIAKERFKIYIIYLKNGTGEKDLYKPVESEIPIILPLRALSNQPFQGSASYFEERAKHNSRIAGQAKLITVQLDNKLVKDTGLATATVTGTRRELEEEILEDLKTEKNDTILNFPLARWLSKSVIRRMQIAASPIELNTYHASILELLNTINGLNNKSEGRSQNLNIINALDTPTLVPFRNLSPNLKIKIRTTAWPSS